MKTRKLDNGKFRVVMTGNDDAISSAVVESVVVDGDMIEKPKRTKLTKNDFEQQLKDFWSEAVSTTKKNEEL